MGDRQITDDFLRDFFGIEEDSGAELEHIRSRLERIQFINGEDICVIDERPDGMFFLESGIAVVLDRDGKQINVMHPGQYFGEYAVLSGQRRLSTVRSLGRTVVYKLDNDAMAEILSRHPGMYGELMKRVYAQVTGKHEQLLALTGMKRGVLRHPGNSTPLTLRRIVIQYGLLAAVFALALILIPRGAPGPVFILPLALMLVYVLITKRTVESLVVSGLLAAALVYRTGITPSYTEALLETIADADNVFTVYIMALMGGVVALIEGSGAVTAFKKAIDKRVKTARGVRLAALGTTAVTSIDDGLNMVVGASSVRSAADDLRIPREETSLLMSFLPTQLSSFLPFSLWGVFVTGTINAVSRGSGVELFCKALPFNFFSIISVLAMVLFCFGRLPLFKSIRNARRRVEQGGELWPKGSERYIVGQNGEIWGRVTNLILPVAALAVFTMTVRTVYSGGFIIDTACGLTATVVFMFFLYVIRVKMPPEQFFDHLLAGIRSMALPVIIYLLTMCFSTLLDQQGMGEYFDEAILTIVPAAKFMPATLFLLGTLFTVALGSSWSMYALIFPLTLRFASVMGLSVSLCIGAVCSAGIAGEKLCVFTGESLAIADAVGIAPDSVTRLRLPYTVVFSLLSLALYVAAGFVF